VPVPVAGARPPAGGGGRGGGGTKVGITMGCVGRDAAAGGFVRGAADVASDVAGDAAIEAEGAELRCSDAAGAADETDCTPGVAAVGPPW
jgi:hypothetical protein